MAVKPNMSLVTSAKSMIDQSELLRTTRGIGLATTSVSTKLWSGTETAKLLTPKAESIAVQNFDKRNQYSLLQSKYF